MFLWIDFGLGKFLGYRRRREMKWSLGFLFVDLDWLIFACCFVLVCISVYCILCTSSRCAAEVL